jgi:hypothetical protein
MIEESFAYIDPAELGDGGVATRRVVDPFTGRF